MAVYDNIDNYIETLKKALEKANKIKEIGNIRLVQKPFEELFRNIEYMSLQVRYDARQLPIERAEKVSESIILEATQHFGYGGEVTKEGWIRLVLPPVLNRRYRKNGNIEQYRNTLYMILNALIKEQKIKGVFADQTVIFKHVVHDMKTSADADNVENKAVLDAVATFLLKDDAFSCIDYYSCASLDTETFLVVYIVPREQSADWFAKYRNSHENLLTTP